MNLHQLYYFRAVAELEHYTLAAGKLMVSPSSLSHAISDLERELGVPLFEPAGRNVRLTKYGRQYLSYVANALDTLDQGNAHMRDCVDPKSGTISIYFNSCLNEFIPHLVSRYLAETGNQRTKFQFLASSPRMIEAGLNDGSCDLAFSSICSSTNLNAHSLGPQELVLIVSPDHPLAQHEAVHLSALADEKLITYNKDYRIRAYIDAMLAKAGVSPKVITESTLDMFLVSAVAANIGVALLPRPLAKPPYPIKILQILDEVPPRNIYLFWRKARYMSPATKGFLDFVLAHDNLLQEILDIQR